MKKVKNSELLLSYIREGRSLTGREKLALITQLSIPSILAQISATVMFFIDASMVGHLGAKASAAIGLVESTSWLMGGLASAANMGSPSCASTVADLLSHLGSDNLRHRYWHLPFPPPLVGRCS